MPHVITGSCCSDGSCVYSCPVNCIHPSPDEPGFGLTEMLYIDPAACVDCGACISVCPREVFSFDPGWKLKLEESKCILCGKCIDACPHRALTLPL